MAPNFRPQVLTVLLGLALLVVALAATGGAGISRPAGPRAGDTYVEAMIGAPHLVNPLLAASDTDTDLTHLLFSGLTRVDEHGEIVPDLADYQVSPDALVYTFTLRPGLKWHDGEPITSDDVRFTLGLLRAPDFPGDPALAAPWHDAQVSVPTAQTVRVTLPTSDASFLQFSTLGILPRHLWEGVKPADLARSGLNQSPVGSGPWRVSPGGSRVDGLANEGTSGTVSGVNGVLLERNAEARASFGTVVSPSISRLWFRLYPNFDAAITGLKLGEVHGVGHIPADRVEEVSRVPGVALHKQRLARYSMLILNLRSPLFDKAQTRQALELAIDKQALADSSGIDSVPAESPILPGSWAYDTSIKGAKYDPVDARRLLDSADWIAGPDGVRAHDGVTMTVVLAANSDIPSNVAVANGLSGYLRAVGVDVKLALVSREALLRDYLGPRAFHLALAGWQARGADPDVFNYWHSSRADTPGGLNFSGWSNPEADKALLDARSTHERGTRATAYRAFQVAFSADAPSMILDIPLYAYATRDSAAGVTLPSTDLLSPAQRFDTLDGWSLRLP